MPDKAKQSNTPRKADTPNTAEKHTAKPESMPRDGVGTGSNVHVDYSKGPGDPGNRRRQPAQKSNIRRGDAAHQRATGEAAEAGGQPSSQTSGATEEDGQL